MDWSSNTDWTMDLILEFLDLYGNEAVLWNPYHASHKNRLEVSAAWERIREDISADLSVFELKRKKDSLMATFRGYYNKSKMSAEHGREYKPPWFAYEKMYSFLRKRHLNDENYPLDGGPEFEFVTTSEGAEGEEGGDDNIDIDSDVDSKANIIKLKRVMVRSSTATPTSEPQRKKLKPTLSELVHRKITPTGQQSRAAREPDDCDLYGDLLANKLRKMDEKMRDIAMNKIDNLMFEIKMTQFGDEAQSDTGSPSGELEAT